MSNGYLFLLPFSWVLFLYYSRKPDFFGMICSEIFVDCWSFFFFLALVFSHSFPEKLVKWYIYNLVFTHYTLLQGSNGFFSHQSSSISPYSCNSLEKHNNILYRLRFIVSNNFKVSDFHRCSLNRFLILV